MKSFKESIQQSITEEGSLKASDVMKILKSNPDDWGQEIDSQVYMKKGNLIFLDSFYYGAEKALDTLEKKWSPKGSYYEYFKKEHKTTPKIVGTISELKAKGRHKKFDTNGIVGVELKFS